MSTATRKYSNTRTPTKAEAQISREIPEGHYSHDSAHTAHDMLQQWTFHYNSTQFAESTPRTDEESRITVGGVQDIKTNSEYDEGTSKENDKVPEQESQKKDSTTRKRGRENTTPLPKEELHAQYKLAIERSKENETEHEAAEKTKKEAAESSKEKKDYRLTALHKLQLLQRRPTKDEIKRQYQDTIQRGIELFLNQKSQLKRATTKTRWDQTKIPMDQQEREEGNAEEERGNDIQIHVITEKATMITKTNNGESIHLPPTAGVQVPPDATPSTIPLNSKQNLNIQSKVIH